MKMNRAALIGTIPILAAAVGFGTVAIADPETPPNPPFVMNPDAEGGGKVNLTAATSGRSRVLADDGSSAGYSNNADLFALPTEPPPGARIPARIPARGTSDDDDAVIAVYATPTSDEVVGYLDRTGFEPLP
jgi:hypothetical protein